MPFGNFRHVRETARLEAVKRSRRAGDTTRTTTASLLAAMAGQALLLPRLLADASFHGF
jgi:hypothetical protein